MNRFSQILYDLGLAIDASLHVDPNGVCQLNYENLLSVQLQYLEPKEQLLIATFLCEVPPGKYREKLFGSCLIQNGEYPMMGTFGFCERNNQLTYFFFISAIELTGEKLLLHLNSLIENSLRWKDAIENGKPLPTIEKPQEGEGGLFGLKP
jgi:uncharacterized protein YjfI (DUF2170 family)